MEEEPALGKTRERSPGRGKASRGCGMAKGMEWMSQEAMCDLSSSTTVGMDGGDQGGWAPACTEALWFGGRGHLSALKESSSFLLNSLRLGIPISLSWYPDVSISCYLQPHWLLHPPHLPSHNTVFFLFLETLSLTEGPRHEPWHLPCLEARFLSLWERKNGFLINTEAQGRRPWQGQLGTRLVRV